MTASVSEWPDMMYRVPMGHAARGPAGSTGPASSFGPPSLRSGAASVAPVGSASVPEGPPARASASPPSIVLDGD